ncbi:hypothetical protein [Paucidesulfovibrio longus]|uniref:hypothetical protein n=1 Tax=Paucidesulfovibrio longus TaxID=889 RepID=UPI0012DEA565|nr:hypothetical protein [Paucidesulfovibrio longus]
MPSRGRITVFIEQSKPVSASSRTMTALPRLSSVVKQTEIDTDSVKDVIESFLEMLNSIQEEGGYEVQSLECAIGVSVEGKVGILSASGGIEANNTVRVTFSKK